MLERAAAAGEGEFFFRDVVPDFPDGGHVVRIAGERGDIGHAGIHVVGGHGVADGFGLLRDGEVLLAVGLATGTAGFEEDFGELDPARVAGHAVELGEAQLDDLVAGGDAEPAVAEVAPEEFGALEAGIEQRALPVASKCATPAS